LGEPGRSDKSNLTKQGEIVFADSKAPKAEAELRPNEGVSGDAACLGYALNVRNFSNSDGPSDA
jgi:hypothetical protein